MNATIHEEEKMRERIVNLIHLLGLTERQFAVRIGRQPANVNKTLTGERRFPRGFCADILKAFPNVNRDWLYFGEGLMCETGRPPVIEKPQNTRPRLPKTMSGGHLVDYYDGEKRELCREKPIIPQFPDYDFTLILKNDRMSPMYRPGDEIAFKKAMFTEWGNDYLIDTPDGPKFKKVFDNGDSVRCVSYNEEKYPEFIVPKNLIFGYYRCVGVIRVL